MIDSGSTDGTLAIARGWPVRIVTMAPENWSYPRALNLGAGMTTGEVIVCLSAHCLPTNERWLENLLRHFDDPVVAGVWGKNEHPRRTPEEPGPPVRQRPGSYNYHNRMWGLSNANSAIRRDLWERFPFDEGLPATEDKAWGMEAMTRGYELVYDPSAAVFHESHSVTAAFVRNRAVVEGFGMIFPDHRARSSGSLAVLGRALWRTVAHHVTQPSLEMIKADLKRGVSVVSALLGSYVGGRSGRANEVPGMALVGRGDHPDSITRRSPVRVPSGTWSLVALTLGFIWAVFMLSRYFSRALDLLHFQDLELSRDLYSLSFLGSLPHFDLADLALWSYPNLTGSVIRSLASIGGAVIVLMAADGAGRLLQRLIDLRAERPLIRVCFRLSMGFGVISLLTLGLASAGLLTRISIWLMSLSLAAFSVGPTAAEVRSIARRARRGPVSPWPAIAAVFLFVGFLLALAPEHQYDAVWYHLGLPRLWLESGGLVFMPTEYVSLYPMTWELIYTLGMGVGGPGAAKLLHFAALPLSAAVVAALARRATPSVPPLLPVAIFVSIPTVLWEATTAYIDLALTFHVSLLLFAIIRFVDTRRDVWLWLGAVNLGMALATKHLALMVVPLVVPGLVLAMRRADGRWSAGVRPALILLSGVALAVPWYVRSYLETGNPVFPELFSVFGAPPEWWDATTEYGLDGFKAVFGRPRTLANLALLPWDITVHGAKYGGSFGPLLLLLAPAALTSRLTTAAKWLALFAIAYFALWASPLSSFQLRFLLPLTPIMALFAAQGAIAASRLMATNGMSRGIRLARWSLAALMILNLPFFMSLHEVDRSGWQGWLTHVAHEIHFDVVLGKETEEEFLARRLPSYLAWEYAEANLAPDSRVLNFMDEDNLYAELDWVAAHATSMRPAVQGSQATDPLPAFDSLGLTHILVSPDHLRDQSQIPPILQPEILASGFERVYEDPRAVLLRRRP